MCGNNPAAVADYYIPKLLDFPEGSKLHGIQDKQDYGDVSRMYKNDPSELAEFFTLAQRELAILAEEFDDHIGGRYRAEPSRNLIDLINILQDFSQDLIDSTGIRMTTRPADLMEQLAGYLKFLKHSNGSEIPESTRKLSLFVLKHNRLFNLTGVQESRHATDGSTDGAGAEEPAPRVPEPAANDTGRKKIYSVFISSTFEDLKEIRKAVMEQLQLTEEYNPIGMEAFTASDENQLDYIRKKMEFIDLYILIIGGRYGSTSSDRKTSYTEREYEMAQKHPDIKTLVFLCKDPERLQQYQCEQDNSKLEQLERFRQRVSQNRMVKYWQAEDRPKDIANMIYRALNELDKKSLRGWIRGPRTSSTKGPNQDLDQAEKDLDQAEKDLLDKEITITGTGHCSIPEDGISDLYMRFTGKVGIPKLLQMMQPTIQNPVSWTKAKRAIESNLCASLNARDFHMTMPCWTDLLTALSIHKLIHKTPGEEDTIAITDTGTEFIRRHPEQTTDLKIKDTHFEGKEAYT